MTRADGMTQADGTMQASLLIHGDALLGEGPLWDSARARILWTDLRAGELLAAALSPADGGPAMVLSRHPDTLSAVLARALGGYALCAHTDIVLVDGDGREEHRIALTLGDGMRLSDACATPEGDLLVGEVDETMARPGRLLRVDGSTGSVETVLDGIGFANGVAFSPDGATLHLVDSGDASVSSYRYPGSGRSLVPSGRFTVPADLGDPDGMAVDAEGALWIALFGGAALRRYRPGSDRTLAVISVPTRQVSSCAFVGDDLATLAITTARVELSEDELGSQSTAQPDAGSLFAAVPAVPGAPVWECAL